ncbi:MAG: elongation factor Ts [Bacteroidia bacterium]|nr:MAG: elongation factor Ts [Bacteroidia bacterium]
MGIKAADVAKLRKLTGVGMMDCKKALAETNGDFDKAIDYLREKGQKVASKRADREATEGVVLGRISKDKKYGVLLVLNCETDFVAKNDDFVKLAHTFAELALEHKPANLDELKALSFDGKTLEEHVVFQTGVIGEKLDLSYFDSIAAENVIAYTHTGNQLAALVGLNMDTEEQVGKDIAMQVAAMDPVAIDKDSVPAEVVERELKVGKEQARQEGKPEKILDKIAEGRLNKYFQENTLLNQAFIKDGKKSVGDYMNETSKDLKVVEFKRFTLNA